MEISDASTIDIKPLLSVLRRGLWILILAFLFGGGVAYLVSRLQTPIYSASTQVIVARTSSSQAVVGDITQALSSQQVAQTYVALLSQPWVMDKVSERVGGSEVSADRINIAAVSNTQIISIEVKDADPVRAALIADTLVQVLIEQNETIQSGRYVEAEKNLDTQIESASQQITDTQAALKQAQADALSVQIENTRTNIQNTQSAVADLQQEVNKLSGLTPASAASLLNYQRNIQTQYQAVLDRQLVNYDTVTAKLADSQVQQDAALVANLQTQLSELESAIAATREQLEALGEEITWLTPYLDANLLERTLAFKNDELATQQSLLRSYQQTYTDLLVTGRINGTTDEITNLEKNLSLYQQVYVNLLSNRETVRLNRMQNALTVVQTNPALASENPVSPRTLLNTLLGAFGALVLAVMGLFLTEMLDTTIKTREDVERELGLPIMGYSLFMEAGSADKEGPYVARMPRSPATEAFRSLRTNLEFIGVDKPLKSLLISSPGASEGKTTIAANLASVIAQGGKRVALLDADFRRPRVHKEMGMSNRVGLSDVFRERINLTDVLQTWDGLNLSVITSGSIPPNPAELLASQKMQQILVELEAQFDLVIIDSTPTIVTDSQLIAARVDGVLIVLWPGRTNAEAARAAVEQYRRVGARLLGVVLNNVQPGQGYGYTPYSHYKYYRYDQADEGGARASVGKLRLPWKNKKVHAAQPETASDTLENT